MRQEQTERSEDRCLRFPPNCAAGEGCEAPLRRRARANCRIRAVSVRSLIDLLFDCRLARTVALSVPPAAPHTYAPLRRHPHSHVSAARTDFESSELSVGAVASARHLARFT